MRLLRIAALVLALVLTVPIAFLGVLARWISTGCECWLILVGRLADSVGWTRR